MSAERVIPQIRIAALKLRAVQRFLRDVRLWTIAFGTSEIMREIIAKRLFRSPALQLIP